MWLFQEMQKKHLKNPTLHLWQFLSKLGVEENFLNSTKNIYKNPTTNITLNGEKLKDCQRSILMQPCTKVPSTAGSWGLNPASHVPWHEAMCPEEGVLFLNFHKGTKRANRSRLCPHCYVTNMLPPEPTWNYIYKSTCLPLCK